MPLDHNWLINFFPNVSFYIFFYIFHSFLRKIKNVQNKIKDLVFLLLPDILFTQGGVELGGRRVSSTHRIEHFAPVVRFAQP